MGFIFSKEHKDSTQEPADTQNPVLLEDDDSTQEPDDTQNPVLLILEEAFRTLKIISGYFIDHHFRDVELDERIPQLGDLFLFELQTPLPVPFVAHVGVYCGRGEIIHYKGTISIEGVDSIRKIFPGYIDGVVYKQGLLAMKHSRKLLRVLRKRGGVDPKELNRRVRKAMNSIPPRYHLIENNCVHFALKMLGMDLASVYGDLPMDSIMDLFKRLLED